MEPLHSAPWKPGQDDCDGFVTHGSVHAALIPTGELLLGYTPALLLGER